MCAVIADPCFSQPPPGALSHACSVAVVRVREDATTVITRVAVPVEYPSGSRPPVTTVAACVVVVFGAAGRDEAEVSGGVLAA